MRRARSGRSVISAAAWAAAAATAPSVAAPWAPSALLEGGGDGARAVLPAERPPNVAGSVSVLGEWVGDGSGAADAQDCRWWLGDKPHAPTQCSVVALTRMSRAVAASALDRAQRCASAFETDCVLSIEIGLEIPAAFVYDPSVGMRSVVAPRVLFDDDDARAAPHDASRRLVELRHPAAAVAVGSAPGPRFLVNDTVRVEYFGDGARQVHTDIFRGEQAFCIQLLRKAIAPECWTALD